MGGGWGLILGIQSSRGQDLPSLRFSDKRYFPVPLPEFEPVPASVKGTATLNKEQSISRKNLNNAFEHVFIITLTSAKISGSKKSEKIYAIVNPS